MRVSCGLTQKQLAVKVGVSGQSISNIESMRHCPSEVHLHKILVALRADTSTMLDFKEKFKKFRSEHNENRRLKGKNH